MSESGGLDFQFKPYINCLVSVNNTKNFKNSRYGFVEFADIRNAEEAL